MRRRGIQHRRDCACVLLTLAREKGSRVVEDDRLPVHMADGHEMKSLVESGNRDLPWRERVIADAEDRETRPILVNRAGATVKNIGMRCQVLPGSRRDS